MPGSKSPVRRRRFVHATQWHALKATYFSGNTVGAYCIRPTNVPFMERISLKRITFFAFIIIKMLFSGMYSSYLYLLFLS